MSEEKAAEHTAAADEAYSTTTLHNNNDTTPTPASSVLKPLADDEKPVIGPNIPTAQVVSAERGLADEKHALTDERPALANNEVAADTVQTTGADDDEVEDESVYPKGGPLLLLTFGLCLALFVVALDNTIIATAIPKITTQFDSLNDVGWYGSSYLLTTTSLQPTFGKIYTYFNVKWTYLVALVIFEVGSVLCAAATNSTMFIVGRAIAGVGAAALFSGGMTIVGYTVPMRKRPIYIALLASMFGISSVIGPILGGVLTDHATWRWCFWINLPFGGIALLAVFFFFHNPKRPDLNLTLKEKLGKIDMVGAFFLICGVICLLLALQWGGSTYAWKNSRIIGLFIGFGLLIGLFIGLQFYRGDDATLPPRIFLKYRTVAACSAFSFFLAMSLYTHIYYLPFYFQAVKLTSAEGSGIRTIPYLVSNTLAAIITGGAITKIGYFSPFMWAGASAFTVGAGLLHTLKLGSSTGKWIGYEILAGLGSGATVQIPFVAIQCVVSAKDMPTGNAIAIFFNSLGGAISISIAQNIFTNTLIQDIPIYAPGVNATTIINAGVKNIVTVTPPDKLVGVLEAYSAAIDRAFILPIACGSLAFLCSLAVEWKSVKGKKIEAAAGGA